MRRKKSLRRSARTRRPRASGCESTISMREWAALGADILSDEEVDDLLAFTYAERHADSWCAHADGEGLLDRGAATFEELRARALVANPFESDEEIDEFIAWVHTKRRREMA